MIVSHTCLVAIRILQVNFNTDCLASLQGVGLQGGMATYKLPTAGFSTRSCWLNNGLHYKPIYDTVIQLIDQNN